MAECVLRKHEAVGSNPTGYTCGCLAQPGQSNRFQIGDAGVQILRHPLHVRVSVVWISFDLVMVETRVQIPRTRTLPYKKYTGTCW